jgi:hypothetical protein
LSSTQKKDACGVYGKSPTINMKNTILSVLAAISVASCSPIPSGTKTEGVHNSTGITCAKILDNTVSDEDIHNSIMNNHWNQ